MTTVEYGEGIKRLASKADATAWAGDLTPAAGEAAKEGLPFRALGVESEEDKAKDILREARKEARHGQ